MKEEDKVHESAEVDFSGTDNPPIRRVEPEGGVRFTYANNVEVGHTLFDVRILFGEILGKKDDSVEIEQRVHVTMTWLQAKMLAQLMAIVVKRYEDANGPIKAPNIDFGTPLKKKSEIL